MTDLIAAVRAHANANYESDGWDFLVECWEDSDIAEAIGNAKTEAAAIARCKKAVKVLGDHRDEVRSTEW